MSDLDEFKEILCNSKMDIWGIIDAAITVASSEYSGELHLRRDAIVGRLHQHHHQHQGGGVHKSTQPPHSGRQTVNLGSNTGQAASFQQQEVGKQVNAKAADAKTVENVSIKNCGKEGVASSSGKDVESHKRSLKWSHVSYCEGAVEKKFRLWKSFRNMEDQQKDKVCDTADWSKDHGKRRMPNDQISVSESEDDSEPIYVDVPDLQFSNFDQDKEEHCFAPHQLWAVYDTIDSMPRFYAYIKKVYAPVFKLRITWLNPNPENKLERKWVRKGLPVACGRFKLGDSEETEDRLMFSHKIAYEKGSKKFSYLIYPKKGEMWALFKDWDVKWSVDSENHMKYKFDIVEILSDFDKENGVVVAFMVKVEGFVSLFKRTSRTQLAQQQIPPSEFLRFSHCIPSSKLTERKGVPVGSCELDTASLPDDLDDYYFSNGFTKRRELCSSSHKDAIVIHDFNLDKQNWTFQEGQIWALNRKCYSQIKKIETSPLRLHVDILDLCCDTTRPTACGLYRASKSEIKVFQRDSFLYLVKAEVIGENRFIIYPRENEIWVLYKKRDAVDCDFVQVVENNGDNIKVFVLSRVAGYKSVFKALEGVVQIPIAESDRFFYRVPAFLLKDELDGWLRGSWELDLEEFPGLPSS